MKPAHGPIRAGCTAIPPSDSKQGSSTASCPVPRWGRRAGVAVFCFFLLKGLAWLALPALAALIAAR